jgi:hypothetical protein
MNKIGFLILILVLAIGLPLFFKFIKMLTVGKDGFSNYTLDGASGSFPKSVNEVLVQDSYPRIKTPGLSSDNASNIWWHSPIFTVGSYDQITNNIKYSNNPDTGSCMPASLCGALYHEKQLKTNYVDTLPPVPLKGNVKRVGYFNSNTMPFVSDNVLK